MKKNLNLKLMACFDLLLKRYGPQRWWPAEELFEVMVGAILTQSAAWTNVEKAITNLKKAGALKPSVLRTIPMKELSVLIYPCGYYNMKARKLKALTAWYGSYLNDDIENVKAFDTTRLRNSLLEVYGVGEETADSILLYACQKPVFIIDAYTRRIIDRLGLRVGGEKYADYQRLFSSNLPADACLFNEYHALLVALGKNQCRKKPLCGGCCLAEICKKK
jgi:endonuclease-3 related protein